MTTSQRILHVDASVLGDHSVSRQVSAAIVRRLTAADPGAKVTYRDLAAAPLGHLAGHHLAALSGAEPAPAHADDVAAGRAALGEFLAADTVVIGAPMYNFTLPTQLKAWIDRLLIAGKTFRYTASGPEGLAGGKRVIVAISRGGVYAPGTPNAAAEHAESYLRTVFGFIGITDLEFVSADGIQLGPEHRERALTAALAAAGGLKAAA
jgi:FMN-dependent NADH-azoreductase